MSVKPILFNTEMVQAILDGRKTVTRRCVKPQPSKVRDITIKEDNKGKYVWGYVDYGDSVAIKDIPFPYQPGDIIYVRETWKKCKVDILQISENGKKTLFTGETHKGFDFAVNSGITGMSFPDGFDYATIDNDHIVRVHEEERWHPSIHMPKEAARIWLQVTDVRVERLQDIKYQKKAMQREGVETCHRCRYKSTCDDLDTARECFLSTDFRNLWNSTIKKQDLDKYGWNANPWVWVIEFERCGKPKEVV